MVHSFPHTFLWAPKQLNRVHAKYRNVYNFQIINWIQGCRNARHIQIHCKKCLFLDHRASRTIPLENGYLTNDISNMQMKGKLNSVCVFSCMFTMPGYQKELIWRPLPMILRTHVPLGPTCDVRHSTVGTPATAALITDARFKRRFVTTDECDN